MNSFPLSRYRFEFTVKKPVRLPEYSGSTLRGAFGHALRTLACVTRMKTCESCILASSCSYKAIFEPQKSQGKTLNTSTPPVPYIIEPPAWGERQFGIGVTLGFHFILIGHSRKHLGIIILAWQRAFSQGIGTENGTANLVAVYYCKQDSEVLIWNGGAIKEHDHSINLPDEPLTSPLTLEFLTPLRLQENGHALPPSRIESRPFLMALVRRSSLLAEYYSTGPLFSSDEFSNLADISGKIEAVKDMRWQDWTRYSSRQGRAMKLGGAIGRITLNGDLDLFYDLLRLGEWLHIGKEASFGLGQYRIIQY